MPSPTGSAASTRYTADRLTYSPDPPAYYGMIEFEDGGRWMMDFTDIDADKLDVGRADAHGVPHQGRRRQRGFRRYFWKAAPAGPTQRRAMTWPRHRTRLPFSAWAARNSASAGTAMRRGTDGRGLRGGDCRRRHRDQADRRGLARDRIEEQHVGQVRRAAWRSRCGCRTSR